MASNDHQNQNLESILSILSAYGPNAPEAASIAEIDAPVRGHGTSTSDYDPRRTRDGHPRAGTFVNDDAMDEAYDPPEAFTHAVRPEINMSLTPGPSREMQPDLHLRLSISASRIVEWSAGLRHVTQLAARDKVLEISVKELIQNQRQNENDWWAAREALLLKQEGRVQEKATLDKLLQSVGGHITSTQGPDPDTELAQFDKKVHRAQATMVRAMGHDLMTLGVPFFGTDNALVMDDTTATNSAEGIASDTKLISKTELLQLQRKMVVYLEDMYND